MPGNIIFARTNAYIPLFTFFFPLLFHREPDEWVLESEVQMTKYVDIRKAVASSPDEVSLALYPAISGRAPPTTRVKQRRKPVKNS